MKDKQGREYARLSVLKAGDWVEVDARFDCMKRARMPVFADTEGQLYLECEEGRHYLDGQLPFDYPNDDSLIGVYPAS